MSDDIEALLVRLGITKPPTPEQAAKEAIKQIVKKTEAMLEMTEDEVDEELQKNGIDPEEAVNRVNEIFKECYKRVKGEVKDELL